MKSKLLLGAVVLAVFILAGCSSKDTPPTAEEARECYMNIHADLYNGKFVSDIKSGSMSITKFEKVDGITGGNATFKELGESVDYTLIVNVEVRANKDAGYCRETFGEPNKKPDCEYKEGQTYSEKNSLEFKKSEKGWRGAGGCLIPR